MWSPMKELFILIAHALTTLVRLIWQPVSDRGCPRLTEIGHRTKPLARYGGSAQASVSE